MSLSMDRLQPDKVPFDLGDGRTIYFRTTKEFDLREYATWQRIQRTWHTIRNRREKAKTADHEIKAEMLNLDNCRAQIGLVLPDMPAEILDNLSPGQTDNLAAICGQVVTGAYKSGAPDPEQLTAVMRQFPDLPPEFVSTLTRGQADLLLPEMAEAQTGPN